METHFVQNFVAMEKRGRCSQWRDDAITICVIIMTGTVCVA
jgi:hypothetical protein